MDLGRNGPWKPRLLALLDAGQADQQAFTAGLTGEEQAATGSADTWAAKDHLAHLTAWKRLSARLLAAAVAGDTPAPPPDESAYNNQIFAAQRTRPWSDLVADAAEVHAALAAALQNCADGDLAATDRFPWREGRPLYTLVLGNGYQHPINHYAQFYTDSGRPEQALPFYTWGVDTMRRLFGEGELFSYAIYNLGCFYARTGQAAPALAAVRQALAAYPGLRAWAGEDTDLLPLHGDPAFQALIAPDSPEEA